ncbi:hypothetical protein HPB47_023381, partial [Ixodes persulcatus]
NGTRGNDKPAPSKQTDVPGISSLTDGICSEPGLTPGSPRFAPRRDPWPARPADVHDHTETFLAPHYGIPECGDAEKSGTERAADEIRGDPGKRITTLAGRHRNARGPRSVVAVLQGETQRNKRTAEPPRQQTSDPDMDRSKGYELAGPVAINRDGKEANAYKNVPDTTLMSSLREMILALGVVHVEPNNTDDNNVGFPVTSQTTLEAETR